MIETKTEVTTVKAVELHRIMKNAMLFASDDDTLPSIHAVHLVCDGRELYTVATDRFTLGVSRIPSYNRGTLAPFAALLHPIDAKRLIDQSKTMKRQWTVREVAIEVNDTAARFTFSTGDELSAPLVDQRFPGWRGLLPKGAPIGRTATAYTAQYMARFGAVGGTDEPMALFTFDASNDRNQKPTVVLVGRDFFGMIMPVRYDATSEPFALPEWVINEGKSP